MTSSHAGSRSGSFAAYGAAIWAAVFAALHLVWAAGWYVGLDATQASAAFKRPLFMAYDVVVAVLCALAVPLVVAPLRPWGRRLQVGWIRFFVWLGTVVLVLRAGASLVQIIVHALQGRFSIARVGIWEPWFYVGATLFALSTWRLWRSLPSAE